MFRQCCIRNPRAVRKFVAVIYAGYAVVIALGIARYVSLRLWLIVCLGIHFIGLLGSLTMDYMETYPIQLGRWRKVVMAVDGAQLIALIVIIATNLDHGPLTGLAALALLGVAFCAYKLWVTRVMGTVVPGGSS